MRPRPVDELAAAAPRGPRCGPAAAALAALLAVTALGASPFEEAADPADVARLRDARLLRFSSADPDGLNRDRSNFVRREGDLAVLAEVDGPGAVLRVWATTEQSSQGDRFDGEILFFFDGAAAPGLTLGLADLFGGRAPFVPPLADYWAGGHFSYVPVPFARGVRIAVRGVEEVFYYHVDVARYPEGTPVETFGLPLGARDEAALARLAARWAAPAADPPRGADEGLASAAADVPPGSAAELLAIDGAGTITTLDVSIQPEDRATLEAARLLIAWDGADTPQVDAPVWDFFGLGFEGETGFIAYDSVPLSVRRGRYRMRLPMPFAAGARLRIENRGRAPLAAIATARYGACAGPQMGRLHAVFNAQSPTVAGADYPLVTLAGRGHFAGLLLGVSGCARLECLEGDERFTLDGAAAPQILGTGTEDYFDAGWYFDLGFRRVAGPVQANPIWAPDAATAFRFHLTAPVPFATGFAAAIEHGGFFAPNTTPASYRSVAYLYLEGAAVCPAPAVPVENAVAGSGGAGCACAAPGARPVGPGGLALLLSLLAAARSRRHR